jgi:hypothetical protein
MARRRTVKHPDVGFNLGCDSPTTVKDPGGRRAEHGGQRR